MALESPIPLLRIFDESIAKRFYVDYLGFTVDWEHRYEEGFPLYMQVSKDRCVIHLTEHSGDCSPAAALRIPTADLESFQKALLEKLQKGSPSIVRKPWGSDDMDIRDPFGNRLTFTKRA